MRHIHTGSVKELRRRNLGRYKVSFNWLRKRLVGKKRKEININKKGMEKGGM